MASPSSSPSLLYQSLAHAIDTAKGTLLLDLNPGRWETKLFAQTIHWIVPVGCTAEIQFDYGGGFLNSASLTFDPPVHVDVPGNLGGALVSSISYNRFGNVVQARLDSTTPTVMTDQTKAKVFANLALDRRSRSLFLGVPFTGVSSAILIDDHGNPVNGAGNIASRVRFTPDANVPALAVTFIDQSVIRFSDSTVGGPGFNNFVTVRKGTGFQFDEIDYFLDDRSISGSLSSFVAVVERGAFSTSSFFLQLQAGTRVQFDHVDFSKSAAGVTIDASLGTLSATVSAGSKIEFASDGRLGSTFLSLDDASQVNLQGFSLAIQDGGSTALKVGGGSSLQLKILQGRIGVADNNFLTLSAGRLNATFSGTWDSQTAPEAVVQISLIDFSNVSGQLGFNANTSLLFLDAVVRSSALTLNSRTSPHVAGILSTLRFTILENSHIGIPGGFQITADVGGTFNNSAPVELGTGTEFPVGMYNISCPIKQVLNSTAPAFSVRNGQALLAVEMQRDGTIVGTNCSLAGTALLVAENLSVSPSVHINSISFRRPPVGDFTFEGKLQASVPTGLRFTVVTPFMKGIPDHDDLRAFPLTLNASVNDTLVVPPTAFSGINNSLTLAPISLRPAFDVSIPEGLGEHEDPDDANSANGQHGPDEDKNLQEAATDKVALHRVHIYLKPDTYQCQAQVEIAINANQLDVDVSSFQTNRDIAFNRDGASFGPFGFLIGLTFGGIIGAIVGVKEGENLDESVNHLIAAGIANMLHGLHHSWHAQI